MIQGSDSPEAGIPAGRGGEAGGRVADWVATARGAILAHPRATRWVLAGPGALIAALVFMAAMPVWLPAGAAGVDNIVYPLVLAPLFWAVAFTYALIEENLLRGSVVLGGVVAVQGAVVALALTIG